MLEERKPLCTHCSTLLTPIVSVLLPLSSTYSLPVHAVAAYRDPLRRLISAKNYGGRIASTQLAELLWHHTSIRSMPCDFIVPIPLHWCRYAWRGFNQSHVMAEVIAKYRGLSVSPILTRHRPTLFQAELCRKDREKNVKNVFTIDYKYAPIRGKHIILIDDLMTTGSTLQEAGRALLALDPASITAVVAARVI